jgi:hypothetical protein
MLLWVLCQGVVKSLDQISLSSMEDAAKKAGLENDEWNGWLFPAYLLAPDDISVSKLRIRMPYVHATFFEAKLVKYTKRGYLTGKENQYFLTPLGMETAENILQARRDALSQGKIISLEQSQQLAVILSKIIQNCRESIEPHSKWCLIHNRSQMDSEEGAHPLVAIDQYLSDICAWRDDCHLASWQPFHYLHGHVWEVFTLLWREEAHSLDEVCDQLCLQRGFSRVEYINAIKELEIRGWVLEQDGVLSLTGAGNKIRHSAEDYTDELFLPPFQSLSTLEQNQLSDLLTHLQNKLTNQ